MVLYRPYVRRVLTSLAYLLWLTIQGQQCYCSYSRNKKHLWYSSLLYRIRIRHSPPKQTVLNFSRRNFLSKDLKITSSSQSRTSGQDEDYVVECRVRFWSSRKSNCFLSSAKTKKALLSITILWTSPSNSCCCYPTNIQIPSWARSSAKDEHLVICLIFLPKLAQNYTIFSNFYSLCRILWEIVV